jgi:hypothetical protein
MRCAEDEIGRWKSKITGGPEAPGQVVGDLGFSSLDGLKPEVIEWLKIKQRLVFDNVFDVRPFHVAPSIRDCFRTSDIHDTKDKSKPRKSYNEQIFYILI